MKVQFYINLTYLKGSDELLTERVNAKTEEEKKGTHYTAEEMERRLKDYRDRNDEAQGVIPLISFFQKRGIEVLTIKIETPEPEQHKAIEEFLEKVYLIKVNSENRKGNWEWLWTRKKLRSKKCNAKKKLSRKKSKRKTFPYCNQNRKNII